MSEILYYPQATTRWFSQSTAISSSLCPMALRLVSWPFYANFSTSCYHKLLFFKTKSRYIQPQWSPQEHALFFFESRRNTGKACLTLGGNNLSETSKEWGQVAAVLFDMDGVLCNSEQLSRLAAVDVFAEMGVQATVQDFIPFMGTGEANFLGGVASSKNIKSFDPVAAKKRFFDIYLEKYAKPNSGIVFPGAYELVLQCKERGLKVAVASSADRIKVNANLEASGLPLALFDAIVSADSFANLKPAPDIFLSASERLDVPPNECVVIEDALAGVEAAKAAGMRCIAVTTTLELDDLERAGPSLIRSSIADISLDDILSGGSGYHNLEKQSSQSDIISTESTTKPSGREIESSQDTLSSEDSVLLIGRFQGSRREFIRYGSLIIAFSCLLFTVANKKALQYASVKAIWNLFFGSNKPPIGSNEDESHYERIQQFITYMSDFENRGTAADIPEFPSKLDWLNVGPLQLRRDLKGKVVLLDFWTYCCINCMHVLPDLEYLENKFKDSPFVVIGVHSAKFDNEKDLDAIRSAVLRYGITHPVVNDGDMYLWRELGISSWPTFVLVAPDGKVIAQLAGEGHRKDLDDLVEAALTYYGRKKLLVSSPIPLNLEKDKGSQTLSSPLKFPGKLESDFINNRLFISDSNHNRVVVTDLDGNFKMQIGSSGEEGLLDGSFDDAMFRRPQGLAYNAKKNVLYVADTENHALRLIDFVNESVITLAGNGMKGSDYQGGQSGTSQLLNSPWDLCFDPENEILYIAMAGQHQIWKHNTKDGTTRAFSGDGFERNLNGISSGSTSFAQPSGISICTDFSKAYVADSESSSIRELDLRTGGSSLLAGGDPIFSDNLFKFGDHDGVGFDVLFQHPLGIFCGKLGEIYIADSYNHKVKKLDLASRRVSTLAGTGKAGFKDGFALDAQLSEPSGLVEAGKGILYIADTNNSLIRILDLNLKTKAALTTLELKGVSPPSLKTKSLRRLRRRLSVETKVIEVDGGSSSEGKLHLDIFLPQGYHMSKEAQSKFLVEVEPEDAALFYPSDGDIGILGSAVINYTRSSSSSSKCRIYCKIYYCKEDEICLYDSQTFEIMFHEAASPAPAAAAAAAEISLSYTITPKYNSNSPLPIPS